MSCVLQCMLSWFTPCQSNQTQRASWTVPWSKTHPLISHEVWLNSVVSQQFLPPVIICPMVCCDASLEKAFSGRGVPHSVLPMWQMLSLHKPCTVGRTLPGLRCHRCGKGKLTSDFDSHCPSRLIWSSLAWEWCLRPCLEVTTLLLHW